MNIKLIALLLGALAAAFAIGRYSAPEKIKVETKVEKVIETQIVEHVVTRVVEKPDGTKETETIIDRDTNRNSNTNSDTSKEIIIAHSRLNVSILAGAQPHLFQGVSIGPIVYGASVSKEILGPFTVGAFGLSDLTFGVSVGLNF